MSRATVDSPRWLAEPTESRDPSLDRDRSRFRGGEGVTGRQATFYKGRRLSTAGERPKGVPAHPITREEKQ